MTTRGFGMGIFGRTPLERFSVEALDARCEEWMKMSGEEKQAFVEERKQTFENRRYGMHGCSGFGQ